MEAHRIVKRFDDLRSLRKTLDGALQDIEHYVVPFRGEFYQDMNSEHQVDWFRREIYDSTAPVSANRLASHIHGNLTSPAIKWFGLSFRQEEMDEEQDAKEWLEACEERVWQALKESDFGVEASEVYLDIVSLGTSHIMQEPKNDLQWEGMDFTAVPMMDCHFEEGGDDALLRFYRILRYTFLQLKDRWPDLSEDDLPKPTGDDKDGSVEMRYDVIFCIFARPDKKDADIDRPLAPEQRPFGYKYVLRKGTIELEEGGYFEMPAMVARWGTVAGSRWGHSPAHQSLSDIKQINDTVAQVSEARSKAIDPPYKATERGVIGDLDLVAGGLTIVTDMDNLAPLENNTNWAEATKELDRLEFNIRSNFFIDMLDLKVSPAMTATEVIERRNRLFQFMSTTVERLITDFLDPVVMNTFGILARQGQLPPQPESVIGQEMDIEYTGPLPRALKSEISIGMQQWIGGVLAMAETRPEVLDIPDWDQMIRTDAELRGVPAKVLKAMDEIKELRAARADQERKMQEAEALQLGGEAAKAIGEGAQAVQAAGGAPDELVSAP